MKSYTKESEQFVPVCKEYFTDWCIDHCNWFGTCWDFQPEGHADQQGRAESINTYFPFEPKKG